MKYVSYKPVRDVIVRDVARRHDIPKRISSRKDFPDEAFRQAVVDASYGDGLSIISNTAIHFAEWRWISTGCRMYFPQSQALLDMLLNARMDLSIEDLGLSNLPPAMAFTMPEMSIGGCPVVGTLLVHGKKSELVHLGQNFSDAFYPPSQSPMRSGMFNAIADEHVFLLCHAIPIGSRNSHYVYFTLPISLLEPCLQSADALRESVREQSDRELQRLVNVPPSVFARANDWLHESSTEEWHAMYWNTTLIVRLLVYMRTCPEKVHAGYPDGESAYNHSSQWIRPAPASIRSPAGLEEDSARNFRDGPCPHFRRWHFRRYPVHQDGSRRAGIVIVKGSFINMSVDPRTIENANASQPQFCESLQAAS